MIIKKRIFILFLVGMSSCSLFKPIPRTQSEVKGSPFIENVVLSLHSTKAKEKPIERTNVTIPSDKPSQDPSELTKQEIEYSSPSAFQYALMLDVEVEKIKNSKLFEYITQWWGTPYRIGGSSLEGVDCSAFVKGLFSETYSIQLPRTSREQADFSQEISKEILREGDLVFFHQRKGISHVGMYLSNNKFVHASTSMGVIISDLNEPYWNKRFVKAGRIINFP